MISGGRMELILAGRIITLFNKAVHARTRNTVGARRTLEYLSITSFEFMMIQFHLQSSIFNQFKLYRVKTLKMESFDD